ncbi:unnamed protein product, partial [Polarella glacialis]
VLETAKALVEKDRLFQERNPAPQVESARDTANQIFDDIKQAVVMGAPPKHPALSEAKGLEVMMRIAEMDRVALKVLQSAESMQAKDAREEAKLAPQIMPVGNAWVLADAVEKEVALCLAKNPGLK